MPIFLMGLGVGSVLLLLGLGVGYFLGSRNVGVDPAQESINSQHFLLFLQNLSRWTTEVAGDVSKYQTQLSSISRRVDDGLTHSAPAEVKQLLGQIMNANQQLQQRLDNAEERLECQTKEIASYLTEARTDGLTGLANRRAFDQQVDEQFKKFAQTKKPFVLALIDIDHFKKINDTHGHPAGDAVLREIANRLRQQMSEAIQVARYGGEEFAILIDRPLQPGADWINELRDAIGTVPVEAEGKQLTVTLSCGVAEIQSDERIGKMVRRADEALYAAKLGGRNRVYLHDGKLCRLVGKPPDPIKTPEIVPNTTPKETESEKQMEAMRMRLQKRLQTIVAEESRRRN